jgi:ABC-type bacteriocin/lantibiotic exporter with double-glycine peptidase domain
MKIPFYYKQQKFSCGPAALRMAIQALIDQDVGEEILIELIGANEEIGTPLPVFESNLAYLLQALCNQYGIENSFEFIIKQNSSINELQILQDTGYVVLLNYTKPDGQAHWAVLASLNKNCISLMDPDFGPDYKYELNEFNWKGGGKIKPTTKALIGIKYLKL